MVFIIIGWQIHYLYGCDIRGRSQVQCIYLQIKYRLSTIILPSPNPKQSTQQQVQRRRSQLRSTPGSLQGDAIADIAADSLRINGALNQFKQVLKRFTVHLLP